MYYFSAGFLTPRQNDSSLDLSADDMRNSGMLRNRGILKAAAAFGGLSTPVGRSSFWHQSSLQNRTDPDAFEKLAEHIANMTMIPRCARRYYLATGELFKGLDVEGFRSLAATGKPWISSTY